MIIKFENVLDYVKQNKLISALMFLSFISSLRNLFLPLFGDELTYVEIAKNLVTIGEYEHYGKPSSLTPSMPFLIALFYLKSNPIVGFILAKIANLIFLVVGLKYLLLYLKINNLKGEITSIILLLTIVNTNVVLWSSMLYPESILFCFFWMFIYYISKELNFSRDTFFIFISLAILILTRYVYAVFAILALYFIFNHVKKLLEIGRYIEIKKIFIYAILCLIPLIFWFTYVYNLEKEVDTGLSYFARFKNNNLIYNIKAGIGLIKHEDVSNTNGIPAFITLFLPITGYRNWVLSIILVLLFIVGFISKWKIENFRILLIAILLLMSGLIFAGTGFSRYWLPLLPGFLIGFYLLFNSLNLKDSKFIILSKIVAAVYVVNELRLDVKVLSDLI